MLYSSGRSRTSLVALAVAGTLAATGAPAAEQASDISTLEEIIVTAQKREENLQDTPISITALSAAAIEDRGINNARDIFGVMPGVTGFEPVSSRGNLSINVRGIGSGNANSPSNDPSNAMYVDGVLYAKGFGLGVDLIDLERIEVLRGPQGTLYGRNTTGGAVNFISRKPTGEAGAKFTAGTGNYGLRDYRARIDLPRFANIAASIVASKRERDPLYRNSNPDVPGFENIDRQGLRFAARWNPTDSFTLDYAYEMNELDEYSQGLRVIGLNPTTAAAAATPGFPTDTATNSTSRSATLAAIQNNLQFLGPAAQTPEVQQFSQWISDYRAWEASMYASGLTDVRSADTAMRSVNEADGHSLVMAWNFEDAGFLGDVEFKSITGYREVENLNSGDLDGQDNAVRPLGAGLTTGLVPDLVLQTIGGLFFDQVHPLLPEATEFQVGQALVNAINERGGSFSFLNFADTEYEQLQQELQMVGASGSLDYAVGVFYFEDEAVFRNNRGSLFPIAFTDTTSHDTDTTAWAVYSQGTWTPSETSPLSLTLGLRYTQETKGVTYLWRSSADPQGFFGPFFAGQSVASTYAANADAESQAPVAGIFGRSFEKDFSNVSGKFTLGWELNDNVNTYLTYSTGYKSGGYNGDFFDTVNDTGDLLRPEKIKNVELGFKSSLLDNRMRLNASAFRYDYTDMHTSTLFARANGSVASRIQNAGEATRTGGELEFEVLATDNLLLSLAYIHISGDFDEYPAVTAPSGLSIDATDYAMRGLSPDNQASANIDWTILQGGFGALSLNLNASWQEEAAAIALTSDAYGSGAASVPVIFRQRLNDSRTLVNARLSLQDIDLGGARLRLSAWSKNLTDEDYQEFFINYGSALGLNVAQYGEPRTYGLDLTVEF